MRLYRRYILQSLFNGGRMIVCS